MTKPGYLTTEFWVTVATNVAAALLVFAPNLSERLGSQWVQPFAIVAAAVANVVYTHTRGKVKTGGAAVPGELLTTLEPVTSPHPAPVLPQVPPLLDAPSGPSSFDVEKTAAKKTTRRR